MKVYRDCINGIPPFDGWPNGTNQMTPAYFTIFNAAGTVVQTGVFTPISKSNVAPTNNSPCAPVTSGIACVEEAIYSVNVNLPPLTGGYYIAYQRCCRNGTILNLITPGAVGATYWEFIPGPEVVINNSSPRFVKRPPIYICANVPIAFNHAATDPDGDSLVYSLCNPFNGLNQSCPALDPANTNCPPANTPPPYVGVPFASPYSGSYPLSSNPAININPRTGFLNGVPNLLGQWVVGVCVDEYRNGVLIATHHRDFQFNVISCPTHPLAGIESQITTNNGQGTGFCNGLTVSYSNSSTDTVRGATTYFWNFGDPNTLSDTSRSHTPTYTFNGLGTYTVMLIVDRWKPCPDTTYEVFQINPLLRPDFLTPSAQCLNGNNFTFIGGGSFQGNGNFIWSFGSNATPSSANTLTVSTVSFNAAGIYTVNFAVAENGCRVDTSKTIEVIIDPLASIGNFVGRGCDPYTITIPNTSLSSGNTNYLWTFSDGTTSTSRNPVHTFSPVGVYSLSLAINTTQGCIGTSTVSSVNSITVNPTPLAGFNATPTITTIFDPDISFTSTTTSPNLISWNYNFGDEATSTLINPVHTYLTWGDYTVTQTVVNNFDCPASATLLIKILPEFRFWIPNAFTPGLLDGLNDIFKPKVIGVSNYTFMIFNRWGDLIYKTNDTEAGWNGTFKGKQSPLDVYVWKCEFRNIVSKKEESHIGHVTLVR